MVRGADLSPDPRSGFDLDHVTGAASERAATDDMLDAAVAAWGAQRLLEDRARSIPAAAPVDQTGRKVTIWV